MGFFSGTKNKSHLNWNDLHQLNQLTEVDEISESKPVIILKHSTRCSISSMAKNRLELYWDDSVGIVPFYLDLINHRDISNEIAVKYNVMHESPQLLLIKNGKCVYNASHNEIDFNTLKKLI